MKKHEKVFFTLGLCMLFSEIAKQFLLTFAVNSGHYDWWHFPFQLCSLPMYLLTVLPFLKSARAKQIILTFLMTYNLLGGIAVFFDTSGMHYPLAILTIHSFSWHVLLIIIGIAAGIIVLETVSPDTENARLSRQTFFQCTLLYFIFCIIASLINYLASPYGEVNMFYINPKYQMEQVFFADITATYGNAAGISAYIAGTVFGAFVLFLGWRLAARLIRR